MLKENNKILNVVFIKNVWFFINFFLNYKFLDLGGLKIYFSIWYMINIKNIFC